MLLDTVVKLSDSAIIKSEANSTLNLNHNFKLQIPNEVQKEIFGISIELANIIIPTLISVLVFGVGLFFNGEVKNLKKRKDYEV